jgi:ABC-type sulfate transport system permease subunit
LPSKKNGRGKNQPISRGTQKIAKQFRLAHLLQIIFCLAFALGARSFWLAWNDPGIPTYATLALGMIVAILAERTRMHFALVVLLVLTVSLLQYGLYCWECFRNSSDREFPHLMTYHYARDLDLYVIVSVIQALLTMIIGCAIAAIIRYVRFFLNKSLHRTEKQRRS